MGAAEGRKSKVNYLINALFNWVKAHKLAALIGGVFLALLICGLLWLAGVNVFNKIGSVWYKAKTYVAQREIEQSKQEAAEAKAVADQALKELAAEKQVTAAERAKREIAEKVLADKTLNANEKLRAYELALQKPITVTPVGDTSDLCERAARLNIACQ